MLELHDALSRKQAIKQPDGRYTSPFPGTTTGEVLCIERGADGKPVMAKRPKDTAGGWECWRDADTIAVFDDAPGGPVAILLVD